MGCLYDPSDRCGMGQDYDDDKKACVCVPGTVPDGTGCKPVPQGLGAACMPAMSSCPDPKYPSCQMAKDSTGYCTKAGCATNDDCPPKFTCATWEAVPYCQRAPTGLSKKCQASSDCAGQDADFCEGFVSHSCQVSGCNVAKNDCHTGTICCDLARLGHPVALCVPKDFCPK